MTRKDYVAIAATINKNFAQPDGCLDDFLNDLCDVFKADNPKFDRQVFMEACGF